MAATMIKLAPDRNWGGGVGRGHEGYKAEGDVSAEMVKVAKLAKAHIRRWPRRCGR